MSRPRLLDAYCCEGGASMGWHRAGFDVYGIDLFKDYTQRRYPFASHKGDVLVVLATLLAGLAVPFTHPDGRVEWLRLEDFVAIHTSPPCQHASAGTRAARAHGTADYPALIPATREALIATGKPYVIENVRGSDLVDPVELCGCMFDLGAVDTDGIWLNLERARRFETNWPLAAPRAHDHSDHEWVGGSYGGARRDKYEAKYVRKGGYVPSKPVQQALLGIDWMTERGMYQALPPAYTEWIGWSLRVHLARALTLTEAAA